LQHHYGIPWSSYGHLLAEVIEHREFAKSHSEKEWKFYYTEVRRVLQFNASGGKIGISRMHLKKAFELLSEKRRQLHCKKDNFSPISPLAGSASN
jgi:hypothetical protein